MKPSFLYSQLFTFGGALKVCLLRVQRLKFYAGLAEDLETLARSQDGVLHPCLPLRQFKRQALCNVLPALMVLTNSFLPIMKEYE